MSAESATTSDVETSSDRSSDFSVSRQLQQSSGSYELVLSGVIFGLLGLLLDRRLETTPVFLLIFTMLGTAGAAISIYYTYRHRISELQAEAAAMRASTTGGISE